MNISDITNLRKDLGVIAIYRIKNRDIMKRWDHREKLTKIVDPKQFEEVRIRGEKRRGKIFQDDTDQGESRSLISKGKELDVNVNVEAFVV